MSILESAIPHADRACARQIYDSLIVCVKGSRPRIITETSPGNLLIRLAGITTPWWTPAVTATAGGNKSASSSYRVYIKWADSKAPLRQCRPSPISLSVSTTASNKTLHVATTGFVAPSEPEVDLIEFYVSLANPAAIAEGGTFYREKVMRIVDFLASGADLDASDGNNSGQQVMTFTGTIPPDCACIEEFGGVTWYGGQDNFEITANLTQGSALVTAPDEVFFPDCLTGRTVYVKDKFIRYGIRNIRSNRLLELTSPYRETSQDAATLIVEGESDKVFHSVLGSAKPVTSLNLAEDVPRTSFSLLEKFDGQPVTGLFRIREALLAFSGSKWWYLTSIQANFKEAERVGWAVRGDRNLCRDDENNVYGLTNEGVRVIRNGMTSEVLTEPVRDFYIPPPGRDDDDCFERTLLDQSVVCFHGRLMILFHIGPRRGQTNNDLILLWTSREQKFVRWFAFEGSPAVTVDITQAIQVEEDGQEELYLAGKMTIGANVYIGRLFKVEAAAYADTAPGGNSYPISWALQTPPMQDDEQRWLQAVEASLDTTPRQGSTSEVTCQVIADTATTDSGVSSYTVAGQLSNRQLYFPLPIICGQALRLRFAGTVQSADDEIEIKRMILGVKRQSQRMR